MGAELAAMKNSEQIDAMKSLGIDWVGQLLVPRLCACVVACISLSLLASGVALFLGLAAAAPRLGYGAAEFATTLFTFARISDLWMCMTKGLVFGVIVYLNSSQAGLNAGSGSEGVGTAATNAVVHSTLGIIVMDVVVTSLWVAL